MGFTSGSSNQSSSSNQYGYSDSLAQSLNQSTQNVWAPQGGALSNLYGRATNLANQQQGQIGGVANQLAGQGGQDTRVGIDALRSIAGGGGPLSQFATPNSALAQQQLSDATSNIQQQMQRVTMPGIQTAAGVPAALAAGGRGSRRAWRWVTRHRRSVRPGRASIRTCITRRHRRRRVNRMRCCRQVQLYRVPLRAHTTLE